MKLNILPSMQDITSRIGKAGLQAKKNSPHIFFGVGVVGVVGSTFLACRATMKLEDTLDEIKEDLEHVKSYPGLHDIDYTKSMVVVYAKTAGKIGRLYGPAVVVGAASIAALTGSHVQLSRRNSALTAAYALVSQAFEEYRIRVQEEVGLDRERDIYHGLKDETKEVDGKTVKFKTNHLGSLSPYHQYFDATNLNWRNDKDLNMFFLQCQQNMANQRLRARGYVLLNDVYESLGFDTTSDGCVVGWLDNDKMKGDKHIDFGVFLNPDNAQFIIGDDDSVLLDFNVDGMIYDKI